MEEQNTNPKLTVITPVFNGREFIEKCLRNVIEQNVGADVEHLIIDGASNDGTPEIIQQYASKYPHIRYISEPDKGQSDAMNKGIKMAKGEWIGFLNADDFYAPFILKRVLTLIKRTVEERILVGNCKLITTEGDLIYINRPMRLKPYHFYSGIEPFPINPSAYFYTKSIHDNSSVGFYGLENHYNMDYEFFLKACLHYPIIYFNEDWGYMLEHFSAKTAQDKQGNEIENRKKRLFNQYLCKAPFKIKAKAALYRGIKSIVK